MTDATPRFDWYQTEQQVVVEVRLKDQKAEEVDVKLDTTKDELVLRIRDEDRLRLVLSHQVGSECSWKVLRTKIEIRLNKLIGVRWASLQRTSDESVSEPLMASATTSTTRYPTSSGRDWNAIGSDVEKQLKEEEEQMEGEQALNSMFSKIYSDGSDEVKRAMNKSFCESGGTVLSTNWSDIGKKKTEVKPPDGMEFKKWDQ